MHLKKGADPCKFSCGVVNSTETGPDLSGCGNSQCCVRAPLGPRICDLDAGAVKELAAFIGQGFFFFLSSAAGAPAVVSPWGN